MSNTEVSLYGRAGPNWFSIRSKVLLLLAIFQVLSIAGLYAIAHAQVMEGYLALERKFLLRNTDRVHNAIAEELKVIDAMARDWSAWDDTYDFMVSRDAQYLESNITEDVFLSAPLNAIGYFDVAGRLVYGCGLDTEEETLAPLGAELLNKIATHRQQLLQTQVEGKTSGLLEVEGTTWLIVSRPILTNDAKGPVRGTLIMARELTAEAVAALAEKLLMDFSLLPLTADTVAARVHGALAQGQRVVIRPIEPNLAETHSYIRDIDQRPIRLLHLREKREMVAQGRRTLDSLVVALGILAVLSTALIVWLQDRLILRRLSRLNDNVHRIRESQDLSLRVNPEGRDELAYFGDSFNAMLAALQNACNNLQQQRDKAETTLSSIHDAVITTDCEGRIEYLNPAAERITGWEQHESQGKRLEEVFCTCDELGNKPQKSIVLMCLEQGRSVRDTDFFMLRNRRGENLVIEEMASPITQQGGHYLGAVLVFRDITAKRAMMQYLTHQATHDPLTSLVNRAEFERRMQLLLREVAKKRAHHALLYIDLDRFKVVNDSCGHNAGDMLLQQLSKQMQVQIRAEDTLARLGGDEFGILLKHCPPDQAYTIAEKLRHWVEDFRFHWQGKSFTVGATIGLVNLSEVPLPEDDPLQLADSACYVAKNEGRNRVHIYRTEDQGLARHKGEIEWATEIAAALDQDRFILYAQEIRALVPDAGSVQAGAHAAPHQAMHYEILLRLQTREGEQVPPGAFLPAAERYGLIGRVDKWVVDRFMKWLAHQQAHLKRRTRFSINLSGHSLGDSKVLVYLLERFELYRIPYWQICFEVTETAAILNLNHATDFIMALRQKGCSFALDDFGVGMSSFAYLKNLPVDLLKIDGSFVRNIVEQPVDYAFVQSINDIGHVMGLKTVAEFVEDEHILRKLTAIGVDFVQGYGIGKPVPLSSIEMDIEK